MHDDWEMDLGTLVEPGARLADGQGMINTHCGVFVLEWDVELLHSIYRHPQAVEDVVEYNDPPFLLLVLGEAILGVNQSHLLQYRRFAALSSTCARD